MSLIAALADAHGALDRLEQTLQHLLWAVVEGQPAGEPGHALVDQYEQPTTDSLSDVQEAKNTIARAQDAARSGPDLAIAAQSLAACQTCLNRVVERHCTQLSAAEWIGALDGLAHERREWEDWAQGVRDALRPGPAVLYETSRSMTRCWQRLTEVAVLLAAHGQRPSGGPSPGEPGVGEGAAAESRGMGPGAPAGEQPATSGHQDAR
jgi:hypothetical protein